MGTVLADGATRMLLAYFDESGDTGFVGSQSKYFCLACVIVPVDAWQKVMDRVIEQRRTLKNVHRFLMREELKASQLRPGTGPWKNLNVRPRSRLVVYRSFMRLQHELAADGLRTFVMAIDKAKVWPKAQTKEYCVDHAWDWALTRLSNFAHFEKSKAIVIPDSGHFGPIRKQVRRIRRHNYVPYEGKTAARQIKFSNLIEDPVERQSHESYLIQLADLNAYAAHRFLDPRPGFPQAMWLDLGDAILLDVNKNRPYHAQYPGMVLWPER